MSVTFSLQPGYVTEDRSFMQAPCPECGGHNPYVTLPAGVERVPASVACGSCHGYGGDSAKEDAYYARLEEQGSLNVANANAAYIVREILNLSEEHIYNGSIDPQELLFKLSLVWNPEAGVVAPSEETWVRLTQDGVGECRTINCGRSLDQIGRYLSQLRKLGELALEHGCKVVWG